MLIISERMLGLGLVIHYGCDALNIHVSRHPGTLDCSLEYLEGSDSRCAPTIVETVTEDEVAEADCYQKIQAVWMEKDSRIEDFVPYPSVFSE